MFARNTKIFENYIIITASANAQQLAIKPAGLKRLVSKFYDKFWHAPVIAH
jgi:hypothetical protein